jgi:hypothetical protein
MSVLASRLDRAFATYRANRSATCGCSRSSPISLCRAGWVVAHAMSPTTGARYRAVGLPLRGGEGHGRLRRVPDVSTKVVVANRGRSTCQGRTTGKLTGCARKLDSSMTHGDRLDCEQLRFELFPGGDRRLSSKASCLIADDVWPLSCDQKWMTPAGRVPVSNPFRSRACSAPRVPSTHTRGLVPASDVTVTGWPT